jgi:pyridoxamine 5'-phosphate oxidase
MDNLLNYFLKTEPLDTFLSWYDDAFKVEQNPAAMTLSTVDTKNMRPDSRTVLYKGMKANSLVFYTNYNSTKAHEIELNNEACIVFYWHVTKRQVRIQGRIKKMDEADSKKYFHSRDRQSQLASLISEQSSPIADKDALLKRLAEADKKYANSEIPYPVNWGGYLFEPYEFEFFVYGDYRINDRFLYQDIDGKWAVTRLQP